MRHIWSWSAPYIYPNYRYPYCRAPLIPDGFHQRKEFGTQPDEEIKIRDIIIPVSTKRNWRARKYSSPFSNLITIASSNMERQGDFMEVRRVNNSTNVPFHCETRLKICQFWTASKNCCLTEHLSNIIRQNREESIIWSMRIAPLRPIPNIIQIFVVALRGIGYAEHLLP
jgi:hypothetical protein